MLLFYSKFCMFLFIWFVFSFFIFCSIIYYLFVILFEWLFVVNGYLSFIEEDIGSWGECIIVVEKIVYFLYVYCCSYSFCRILYQICYMIYVVSIIFVWNVNIDSEILLFISYFVVCLKVFEEMKFVYLGLLRMLVIIWLLMGWLGVNVDDQFLENISIFCELKFFLYVNLGCLIFLVL